MTPPLHPRSRLTTSLFGTTLLVSFLVVGMPHILPCPAPRVRLADAEIQIDADGRKRRKRATGHPEALAESRNPGNIMPLEDISEDERAVMRRKAHECPVPKPKGWVGQLFGVSPAGPEPARPTPPASSKVEVQARD